MDIIILFIIIFGTIGFIGKKLDKKKLDKSLDPIRLPEEKNEVKYSLIKESDEIGRPNKLIAICVNLAYAQPFSICGIGYTIMENGEIKESDFQYVKPPEELFTTHYFLKHGIKLEEVKDSPTFAELWETKYKPLFADHVIVSANAEQDLLALVYVLKAYRLQAFDFKYLDLETITEEEFRLPNNDLLNVIGYLELGDTMPKGAKEQSDLIARLMVKIYENKDLETEIYTVSK